MKRVLLLGLLAVFTAGCGESSQEPSGQASEDPSVSISEPPASEPLTKEEYQQGILAVRERAGPAESLYEDLVVDELPQEQCAERARRFHIALAGIVSDVEALTPPEDVAALQERFLVAARESVDEVGRVVERVEAGELRCGDELNSALYGLPSTERANAVLPELESKGYFVFGE